MDDRPYEAGLRGNLCSIVSKESPIATSSSARAPGLPPPGPSSKSGLLGGLATIVVALALLEVTSGIIQGFYTPILTDIARHFGVHDSDVNWLDAAQFMFSALTVPVLAKLGDLYGHRTILLWTTAITAVASLAMALAPGFWSFLVAWAFQGAYLVWLPLEVALIYLAATASYSTTGKEAPALTRRATGILVAGLQVGVIAGALVSGALADRMSLTSLLILPAVAVALSFCAVLFMVPKDRGRAGARAQIDTVGVVLLTVALSIFMADLVLVRSQGAASVWPWLLMLVALMVLIPFGRHEREHPDPIIDVAMLRDRSRWPIAVVAGLFGVSILGAQAPLSTFARTDPDLVGYGVGLDAAQVSYVIGVYVVALFAGALMYSPASRWFTPRIALVLASLLVATGFGLFLPFHHEMVSMLGNMVLVGLGSGALVAALPAAAAAAAPPSQTGMATGLTNTTKTIGGAIASAVFGVALFQGVSQAAVESGHTAAPLSGYLTVWALCACAALISALLLLLIPKRAFTAPVPSTT